VTIALASTPAAAEIYDMTTKEVVGVTPFEFELPGGREPRRYTLRLTGYGGKLIELVPSEDVSYEAELKALVGGAPTAPEPAVEVVPQKHGKSPGSGAVARPGSGSGTDGPAAIPDGPATIRQRRQPGCGSGKCRGSGSSRAKPGCTPSKPTRRRGPNRIRIRSR
jgi:hypothetical protein